MKTNLKKIRESRTEYTQRDMAKQLGIEVSTYSKWEQGQRDLSAPNLIKLVRILGVTSDDIIGTEYTDMQSPNVVDNDVTRDEQLLLDAYRQLDDADRATVTRVVYALLDTAEHGDM